MTAPLPAPLLASALARPGSTVFGIDAYPELPTKVAAQLETVVRNHALDDGNKRAGWTLAVVTIDINNLDLPHDEDEAFAMVMSVADGTSTLADIAAWFGDRVSPRQDGPG